MPRLTPAGSTVVALILGVASIASAQAPPSTAPPNAPSTPAVPPTPPTGPRTPPGAPPGAPGAPAAPTTPGQGPGQGPGQQQSADSFPPMYRGQARAVLDFIDAIKERDADALAEATALRAPKDPDVATDRQKLFQLILDKELPDEKMEHLAEQFEGCQITNIIVGKSTGRANVIVTRMTNNDRLDKTVVVRKEKAGWKVTDFSTDRSYVGRKSRGKIRN